MAKPIPSTEQHSYLIIGAGVFGVSTAYTLIKKYPNAAITLLDRDAYDAPSRCAASWDWNKVVRADYDDYIYCRLAVEAQDIFKTDPLWQPYFHQTGIYWLCRSEYAQDVIGNYARMGRKADLKAYPVEEARRLYGGLFAEADFSGVKEVLVNKTSGWAAAGDCLRAVTKEALRLGVKYVIAEAATLEFDSRGRCIGVQTTKGEVVSATKTILATGAFTPKILEGSAQQSGNQKLCVDGRIVAGGIATGMHTLDQTTYPEFAKMPVGMQGYLADTGPFLGSLPPTRDRELKWWGSLIFTNFKEVTPGKFVSIPPSNSDYGQWQVASKLQEDLKYVRDVFYGSRSNDWKMEKHRICWDAFTTSNDFIISPQPAAKNLYIATCGNFHGWKFFPVLGKYVVQMIEGSLEPELVQKWAWDRERPDASINAEYPRYELNDLLDSKPML